MAFHPGINEPQPGPHITHPALYIRDVADAYKVLEAVRLNILPLIRRRLLAHEREQLMSGNVFVWEQSEDSEDGGLVRWTEGRRWARGDYLFYDEKIEITEEEKQAKAARRLVTCLFLASQKGKDRPSKVNGLTKQTYSATVRMPGGSNTRKWHIVAYFSATDYTHLPVVDDYDYLRCIRVPDGVFTNNQPTSRNHDRFLPHSDEFDSARGSQSPDCHQHGLTVKGQNIPSCYLRRSHHQEKPMHESVYPPCHRSVTTRPGLDFNDISRHPQPRICALHFPWRIVVS
ncbi:hypothetical protein MVEN_00649100 [Mycena venus]|uniref:Gti1/Pac2 family-domain-containing protein n=1 Tax=Mycena venus TaxID=2733690 RepID=A0A8H6YS76_9AGAR|nr:hypothetical protein MVEN_00649100 [Mycena venus]